MKWVGKAWQVWTHQLEIVARLLCFREISRFFDDNWLQSEPDGMMFREEWLQVDDQSENDEDKLPALPFWKLYTRWLVSCYWFVLESNVVVKVSRNNIYF